MKRSTVAAGAALLTMALAGQGAAAAEEEERVLGWSQEAELSLVALSGNAESETIGWKASFLKTMERSALRLSASGLRAESTTTGLTATGPPPYTVSEVKTTALTAENYSALARYDQALRESLFWYTALSWESNEFAGFESRLSAIVGLGHVWWSDETSRLRTDYGVTWTAQDDLVVNPAVDDSFLGVELSYDYWRHLTPTTEWTSALIVDHNIDESEDLRADFTNSISIAISERLALKLSVQALYDNLPALTGVPLVEADGTPTGTTVPFRLEELDTSWTTALVVDF